MDAIQQDVDQEVQEATEERAEPQPISQHESELERIASSVHDGIIRDEEEESQTQTESEPEQDFSNPLTKKSDEWYVTAKVDGEETDVRWEDVLSQYQKNSSADKRLQEASERQRELEEYEAKLNAYRSHLESQVTQPSSDAGDEVSPSSDATDDLYGQYHDALFQGDETKANSLLKKIRAAEKPSTPEIDVNDIIERTKAEMREEEKQARERGYETRRQDAVKMFHDEYPDIAGDPSLLAVADRRSAELYSDNPTRDPWDIMQECADYARTWLNSYVEKMGGAKGEDQRTQRKQNMDEVVPRNVKATIGEDQVEPTYSDIIAEMKQGRGQPA